MIIYLSARRLTLGLVGCGTIATQAARMCAPLVGRILTFDPFAVEIPAFVERVDKLDDLLIQSQLLSLHLPLSAQTLRHHDSLLQQLASHDHALDLVGALVDLGDSRAAGSFRS
jgi:lactate dehydrogenase-like 2-hydroxyacid dehydrogenase